METEQIILLVINLLGGTAVVGSYIHGIKTHPNTRGKAWGNVPAGLKLWYTLSMLTAAAGYLAFAYFILFEADPDDIEILGGDGFWVFYIICAAILIPSALWMPLTFSMIERPRGAKWFAIRLVLVVVGIASIGLLASLITLELGEPPAAYRASVIGICFFCIQTALLDALIWPVYFPIQR